VADGLERKVKKPWPATSTIPRAPAKLGTTMTGNGEPSHATSNDLQKLKEKLEEEIKARKELEKLSKQIEITITPEGLRIELIEDKNGTFYQSGSAR
jgi:chemotaxis protein MotB